MAYCFDTSAIIEPWRRTHPRDIFRTLWNGIETLIDSGEIVCPDEVFYELERKDDEILEWARRRGQMFIPIDDGIQDAVTNILATANFENLIKPGSQRNQADPFVIGLAQVRRLTVVTYERRQGSIKKPTIPDVCSHFDISCVGLVDLMRAEGWTF